VSTEVYLALERLAHRYGITKRQMLERLVSRKDDAVDSVKQHVRFTDNHLGRSAKVIAAGQVVMVVAAPSLLSLGNFSCI
jgi:hypothetical protein